MSKNFEATLYSLLLLSSLSIRIFSINENYFAEIPIALLIVYSAFHKDDCYHLFLSTFKKFKFQILFITIFLLINIVIGVAHHSNFLAAYADARSNAFVALGFLVGLEACDSNSGRETLIRIAYASTALACIEWLFLLITGQLGVKYPSIIFAPIFILLAAVHYSPSAKNTITPLLLIIFLSVVSFNRQYWIYPITGILITLFCSKNRLPIRGVITTAIISTVFFIFLMPIVISYFSSDESRYIQSLGKLNDLDLFLSGTGQLSESDALRLGYIEYILTHWQNLIIPHGLGSREFFGSIDPWFNQFYIDANTIDIGYLYIGFHYGLIPLVAVMFYTTKAAASIYSIVGILGTIGIITPLLIPMFLDGGTITVLQRSLWYGVYAGLIIHLAKSKKSKNLAGNHQYEH